MNLTLIDEVKFLKFEHSYIVKMLLVVLISFGCNHCATIQPGERGVKKTFGKLDTEVLTPGLSWYNPFFTSIVRVPVRTINREVNLSLPSKEGTTIQAQISILYKVKAESVISILEKIGGNYEQTLILTSFRSAAADITSKHLAKDMHSSQRTNIGKEITALMNKALAQRGFKVESVLLKSISLPRRLTQSIEEKLQAEQEAQRMTFILQREKMEAKRRLVEAHGIRKSQKVISEGLTTKILKWQAIEAFKELAKSNNAKIIITDGKAPLFIPDAK